VPSDAAERRQAAALHAFLKRHPWLAKLVRRSSPWVASWFIVAIGLIELIRLLGLARFFDQVVDLLAHGQIVAIVCVAIVAIVGSRCFLAWLGFRERSQRADREHEIALVRLLLAESPQTASLLGDLLKVLLTRGRGPESEFHRAESAPKSQDRTDKPASHERGRVMPDDPRHEDAPGSKHPPSSGVL